MSPSPLLFKAMKPRQEALQAKMKKIITDWIAQNPEDQAKLRSPVQS